MSAEDLVEEQMPRQRQQRLLPWRPTCPIQNQVQYTLRDTGVVRSLMDAAVVGTSVPTVLRDEPSALATYLELSSTMERIPYRSKESATAPDSCWVDLWRPYAKSTPQSSKQGPPLVIFVHGGAWGSGFPALYRLVAQPFLNAGYAVAVVGYRTYPDADCNGQVEDITLAVEKLVHCNSAWKSITLLGHSSGAHISALALQRSLRPGLVDRFVGLSGVYDIPDHYRFEQERGIARFSPLAPVCGSSVAEWRRNSPTRIARLGNSKQQYPPAILICHGMLDETVPYISSVKFAEALRSGTEAKKSSICLQILESVEHSDAAKQLMFGGSTLDTILEWMAGS